MMEATKFVSCGHNKTSVILDKEDQLNITRAMIIPQLKKKFKTQISAQLVRNKIELIFNGHIPEGEIYG